MPTFKPAHYTSVAPYLFVKGAEATITFLREALGATELRRSSGPDGRVYHAEVLLDDTVVMLTDAAPPDWPAVQAHVHVYVPDVDASYHKAIAAGAVSVQAPAQKGDEDRRSGVRDSGGTTWWIATRVG